MWLIIVAANHVPSEQYCFGSFAIVSWSSINLLIVLLVKDPLIFLSANVSC